MTLSRDTWVSIAKIDNQALRGATGVCFCGIQFCLPLLGMFLVAKLTTLLFKSSLLHN